MNENNEYKRLKKHYQEQEFWLHWGPYLSERAWGTVREDYSNDSEAWEYFTHDHARSRVYRWNEDGLAGISDDKGQMCFALALWNGQDPILKERLFGLTGSEGNHGEDVKEYYFYLDSTPTHSYMKMLYKYPQTAFPYSQLIDENARRGKDEPEFELFETGAFDENRYFDIFVEYAKADTDDILIRISAVNRGPETAIIHLLPTLWFRNTWAWGNDNKKPNLYLLGENINSPSHKYRTIKAKHHILGHYHLYCEDVDRTLFTNNETNTQLLFGQKNVDHYVKDAFHEYIIHGNHDAVSPEHKGSKAAAHYVRAIEPGGTSTIRLRLSIVPNLHQTKIQNPFADFDNIFTKAKKDADIFYKKFQPEKLDKERKAIQRQAMAGMLWTKQFYHYVVEQWIKGDPAKPEPPPERKQGRNHEWRHLYNERVMSMPDKWEYPWYAAWDLAFHCIPLAMMDPEFAKSQIDLLLREWYQHPNGQIPAYEWEFSDVNPPVMAWAAWRIYKIEQKHYKNSDRMFLERVFHKLMLNFTWWVNRKDAEGNNIFQGGFLGLDNIGIFDRSSPLPTGGHIEQSDSTSWMAMFSLNMMTIALELAKTNPVYENIAIKFFEHFLYIADAMNNLGEEGISLWDKEDKFFYDVLHLPDHSNMPLKVRSFVGLIPLFAVETIEPQLLAAMPAFHKHTQWFLDKRPDLTRLVSRWYEPGLGERRLMTLVRGSRLKSLLRRALDPNEFLSDYGIRALSRYHADHPYNLTVDGNQYTVSYEPAESKSYMFGGNSNWRGPVWFPLNYLLIESLQKYHHYYGNDFKVECPTGSGKYLTLNQIADELSQRLIRLFLPDDKGNRPIFGGQQHFQNDPHWRDYILFYEYFHGDNGAGIGASHQTGWTGLVIKLIQNQAKYKK